MLIERLTAEDISMMDTWRKWYAWSQDAHNNSNGYAPMEHVLREWDVQKSQYLDKLFGGQLKMTKHMQYTKSYEELQDELCDMMQPYSRFGRAERNGYEFITAWNNHLYNNRFSLTEDQYEGLRRLTNDDCLISNIYDGYSFEVKAADDKPFRVNRGCKVSKALGKLATIFNLPGWEDFRICHSQILNQKTLGGDLTISIHPLDYMTMSDNTYGWESCMSWEQEGGYRQGTVEMMNSRSVVVAYLSGGDGLKIGDYCWNSKKWRQLFVVDHNVIAGVKDYPYHNEDLGYEVVKWLRELAIERLGWRYMDPYSFKFDGERVCLDYLPEEKNNFALEFKSGAMYNDFGCLDGHWMCFSTGIDPEEIQGCNNSPNRWNRPYLPVEYSGASQCMICGDCHPDLEDESCLACENCQNRCRCDCCGEVVSETWSIDGLDLCECCWENRVHECIACGEDHHDENMVPLFVIPRISPEMRQDLCESWMDRNRYWSCGFISSRDELEQAEYNYFRDEAPNGWFCESKIACQENWINEFLKPGERPHRREWRWSREVCVYFDQLNDRGLETLVGDLYESNEEYLKTFCDYHCQPTKFIELL